MSALFFKRWEEMGGYMDRNKIVVEVVGPVWAYRKDHRRAARIEVHLHQFYGGLELADAKKLYKMLGEAIAIAEPMTIESVRPVKEKL